MRKLNVFNLVTLDGYFAGEGGDISWHLVDDEFQELAKAAANSGNTLALLCADSAGRGAGGEIRDVNL